MRGMGAIVVLLEEMRDEAVRELGTIRRETDTLRRLFVYRQLSKIGRMERKIEEFIDERRQDGTN